MGASWLFAGLGQGCAALCLVDSPCWSDPARGPQWDSEGLVRKQQDCPTEGEVLLWSPFRTGKDCWRGGAEAKTAGSWDPNSRRGQAGPRPLKPVPTPPPPTPAPLPRAPLQPPPPPGQGLRQPSPGRAKAGAGGTRRRAEAPPGTLLTLPGGERGGVLGGAGSLRRAALNTGRKASPAPKRGQPRAGCPSPSQCIPRCPRMRATSLRDGVPENALGGPVCPQSPPKRAPPGPPPRPARRCLPASLPLW